MSGGRAGRSAARASSSLLCSSSSSACSASSFAPFSDVPAGADSSAACAHHDPASVRPVVRAVGLCAACLVVRVPRLDVITTARAVVLLLALLVLLLRAASPACPAARPLPTHLVLEVLVTARVLGDRAQAGEGRRVSAATTARARCVRLTLQSGSLRAPPRPAAESARVNATHDGRTAEWSGFGTWYSVSGMRRSRLKVCGPSAASMV